MALAFAGHDSALAAEPTATASPAGAGLSFSVGGRGLESLAYNGQKLIGSSRSGELEPAKSFVRSAFDALFKAPPAASATPQKTATNAIDLVYPWGRVACAYRGDGDALMMDIKVTNTSSNRLDEVPLRLMELTFAKTPTARTLDAGMFGFGFKGEPHPLSDYPLYGDPTYVTPIIEVNFDNGTLNFCSDDLRSVPSVPYATNPLAGTSYPFVLTARGLEPGQTIMLKASLRFGPRGKTMVDLSGDIVRAYVQRHPCVLDWPDRRPIGMIFLASSGMKEPGNPRRWIMNNGKLDVSNDQGKANFRALLLKWADDTVAILNEVGAQGMITWDPEGQEFMDAVYYGDPRLTAALAPETDYRGDAVRNTMDEYFAKFRAAGLKVGICIRPQQITMTNGKPVQGVADNEHALAILKAKLAYAKARWGCTLFYVDSSVDRNHQPLDPALFEELAKSFPDVLLMPENESMRYFASTAPLNSYGHHHVTSTPTGARTVYPKSFSALMVPFGDEPLDHNSLIAAIKSGDILLFNCWYRHQGVEKIKALYREAGTLPPMPKPGR